MTPTDLVYRMTAVQGASGFGLLIALYDTLAGDLRRAAEAQRARALDKRAKELNHAIAVIGVLQNWVDPGSGDLAKQLSSFYTQLRRTIMQAQVQQDAAMLEELMNETLHIRETWQRLDLRSEQSGPEILPPAPAPQYGGLPSLQLTERHMSWCA
jgi:flagellar secretion chaperone FliS